LRAKAKGGGFTPLNKYARERPQWAQHNAAYAEEARATEEGIRTISEQDKSLVASIEEEFGSIRCGR